MAHDPEYLSVRFFAEHFGVSHQTIRNLIKRGRLQAIVPGKLISDYRIPRSELIRLEGRQTQEQESPKKKRRGRPSKIPYE